MSSVAGGLAIPLADERFNRRPPSAAPDPRRAASMSDVSRRGESPEQHGVASRDVAACEVRTDAAAPIVAERFDGAARARRRSHLAREASERLVQLAAHLKPEDRALVEAVYDHGMTLRTAATMQGRLPVLVRRRLARLLARLTSVEFAFVVRHLDRWTEPRRSIARLVFLERRTRLQVAAALGVSPHTVRRETGAIRVLLEQAREMGRLS
jgi:hypothetical protein